MARCCLIVALAAIPVVAQPALGQAADPYDPPSLTFTPDAAAAQDFDKYFYFHRTETSFAQALADIMECDDFARATDFGMFSGSRQLMTRKANLRVCMGYKGYRRYGLPRAIWQSFNSDAVKPEPTEAERTRMVIQQARAASGPLPAQPELK